LPQGRTSLRQSRIQDPIQAVLLKTDCIPALCIQERSMFSVLLSARSRKRTCRKSHPEANEPQGRATRKTKTSYKDAPTNAVARSGRSVMGCEGNENEPAPSSAAAGLGPCVRSLNRVTDGEDHWTTGAQAKKRQRQKDFRAFSSNMRQHSGRMLCHRSGRVNMSELSRSTVPHSAGSSSAQRCGQCLHSASRRSFPSETSTLVKF